ncbi:uncharacterized protein TM35_000161120 [Trypanosoma theileri]|uniref:Uncharacterized protein n=1 Tax=Trypanosoma theileri TaxID=67003 RepID=A0A1X0NUV0_9TRYP|nr:uncharacterized protein TM35_000161120 [Trypanosoma theileri]ORC88474.1 hypothetical protein TM35_000161120 [Trypanosoma theileri]
MSSGVTPTPVDPELQAEALQRFNPLVFTFAVQTGNTICLPKIIESMTRDPAFAKDFYVLDRKGAGPPAPEPRGRSSERRSKMADGAKSAAAQLREDFVRIAVEREVRRREVERAAAAELQALTALFVEEGLDPVAAERAALEERAAAAAERASSDGDDGGHERPAAYVLLPVCPATVEEVVELHNSGLPLHAVVALSSRVPLSGSLAAETPPYPADTAKGKGKGRRESKKVGTQREKNPHVEEKAPSSLIAELQQYIATEKRSPPFLSDICVHIYDVPTEAIPSSNAAAIITPNVTSSAATGDSGATLMYRLKGTEGAVFAAIMDVVVLLGERYINYCEWKQLRIELNTPSYFPLSYPQTSEVAPSTMEEKGRKKSVSSKKKNNAPVPVTPPAFIEPIPVFEASPKYMKDVVAHRSLYDSILGEGKLGSFDKSVFRTACVLQIAATLSRISPEYLDPYPNAVKRERQQMIKDKDDATAFVKYIFDVALQGVGAAYLNALSSSGKSLVSEKTNLGSAISTSTNTENISLADDKTNYSSLSPCVDDDDDNNRSINMKEVVISLLCQLFDMNMEQASQLVTEVTSLGIIHTGARTELKEILDMNKSLSWQRNIEKVGRFEVEVLYRGDGSSRTEGSVYAFHGSTSFSDYVEMEKYCAKEELYYTPPPPDSDEEEPSDEEEEEEEEEEEGKDDDKEEREVKEISEDVVGKKKKTTRGKKTEELPPVDPIEEADTTLRRRRTYEDISRRLHQKEMIEQELMVSGSGAHCIAQELQWMFADDGSTIEVRRIVGNTRQMHCTVTNPGGLVFGFMTLEEPLPEGIPPEISSGVRSFLIIEDVLRFFFEVVADNTDAVEQAAYIRAVEAAKLEAKAQHDALEQAKPSKGNKEKVALPTLAALEESLVSEIPLPIKREKKPPQTNVRALLRNETEVIFSASDKYLQLSVIRRLLHSTLIDLLLDVWSGNGVCTIKLHYIEAITIYADGCVVLHSPDIGGYRVCLDMFGNYITVNNDGVIVRVTALGKRTVVKSDGIIMPLDPLLVSQSVDQLTGKQVLKRQDGVEVTWTSTDHHEGVIYCTGCSCSRVDKGFMWHFAGYPMVRVDVDPSRLALLVDNIETIMDVEEKTLRLIHARSGGEAVLDWKTHRLHVRPMMDGNCFTIDSAFAGLFALSESTSYCVSPFGRCGEIREDVFKSKEVVCENFVQYFEENGGKIEESALHMTHTTYSPFSVGKSTHNTKSLLKNATAISHTKYAERKIDSLITYDKKPCKDLFRIVLHSGSGLPLIFVNPWVSRVFLNRLKADINPVYSRPLLSGSFAEGAIQEHILFLPSLCKDTKVDSLEILPLATSVAQFSLIPKVQSTTRHLMEKEVDAIHIVTLKSDAHLDTDVIEKLLHGVYLLSREEEMWSKAMITLPPTEVSLSTTRAVTETRRLSSLHDFAVVEAKVPPVNSSLFRNRKTKKTNYNYWRFTEVLVAEEKNNVKLNANNNNNNNNTTKKNNTAESIQAAHNKEENGAAIAYSESPITMESQVKGNHLPVMHSTIKKEMPQQEHHFVPSLTVSPPTLSFGRVVRGYRYALTLALTNTSTVPCRYRITFPAEYKKILRVDYPRHFLAAGLTIVAKVELSGMQPIGAMCVQLNIAHEGGTTAVSVEFETLSESDNALVSSQNTSVVLVGPTPLNTFVPGTTHRRPPHLIQRELEEGNGTDVVS